MLCTTIVATDGHFRGPYCYGLSPIISNLYREVLSKWIKTQTNFKVKQILAWVLLASLLQVIVACEDEAVKRAEDTSVDEVPNDAGPPINSLSECEWLLLNYKYKRLPANLQKKSAIQFSKSAEGTFFVSGTSFLNQYSSVFTLDEKKQLVLSVHDLISTLMGGTDEQVGAEEYYFKRLYNTKSYGLSGNVLTLNFDGGEVGYFVPER